MNIAVVILMIHYQVPQPYAVLSFFAWLMTFDNLATAHVERCNIRSILGYHQDDKVPLICGSATSSHNTKIKVKPVITEHQKLAIKLIGVEVFLAIIFTILSYYAGNVVALITA